MDVVGRTPLNEVFRSPLKELQIKPTAFKEECELLIQTSEAVSGPNPPVDGFVEQGPGGIISALNAMSWSQVPSHPAYDPITGPIHLKRVDNIGAGDPIPGWPYGGTIQGSNLNGVKYNGVGPVFSTIWPLLPPLSTTQGNYWQNAVDQYSIWVYDPGIFFKPGPTTFYQNSLYGQRCRWRANRPLNVFVGFATVLNAFNNAVGGNWFPAGYDTLSGGLGPTGNWMITNAQIISQMSLAANTWLELPSPTNSGASGFPNRRLAFMGQIWFSVHTETKSAWSSRTGVTLS